MKALGGGTDQQHAGAAPENAARARVAPGVARGMGARGRDAPVVGNSEGWGEGERCAGK
jgi:hypothetical protein